MGIFNWKKFPYTNFHDLNLDYFINKFDEIFSEWADLYNTMNTWKDETDTGLEEWKTSVENGIIRRELELRAELNEWKAQTETDISSWETATLNALNAWKTATTAVFEQIRDDAAGNAESARQWAHGAYENAERAYEYKEAAEDAAESIEASAEQIQTNKDNINDLITVIGNVPMLFNGYISAGKWVIADSPRSIIIPVSGGENLSITANSSRYTYYAGLTQFDNPQNDDIPDFSSATGWTGNIYIDAEFTANKTIPSDVKYLYVFTGENNIAKPSTVLINDYDYCKAIMDYISDITGDIDSMPETIFSDLAKARLINCIQNFAWIVSDGKDILQIFCDSIGVTGWIDIKPKSSIDGTTGLIDNSVGTNRQASDFIDVTGYSAIRGVLLDALEYQIFFVVRCYDEDKEYLGTASTTGGETGTKNGDIKRNLLTDTAFIRFVLTPDNTIPGNTNQDLNGIYTSRMLGLYLYDANNIETVKKYELNEVEDFNL